MSLHGTTDVMYLARNVQKNWGLSDPITAFRQHLRPHPADKPQNWGLRVWQALDQISALIPECRGHVAFQEKIEKLWREEKRVKVKGITSEDLGNVLAYFQDFVQGSTGQQVNAEEAVGIEDGIRINDGRVGIGIGAMSDTADSHAYIDQCSPLISPTSSSSRTSFSSTSSKRSGDKRSSSETSDADITSELTRKRSRQKPRELMSSKSPDRMTRPEVIRGIAIAWQLSTIHDIFIDSQMRPSGPAIKWSLPLLRALFSLAQKSTEHRITACQKMKESFKMRIAKRTAANLSFGKKAPSGMRIHTDDIAYASSYLDNLSSDPETPTSSPSSSPASSTPQPPSPASDNSSHCSSASVPAIVPLATTHRPPKLPPSFVPRKQGPLAHAELSVREARQALIAERVNLSAAIQGLGDIVADVADVDARLAKAYRGLGEHLLTAEVRYMEEQLGSVLDEARDRMKLVGLAENRRNVCRRDLKDKEELVVLMRAEEEANGV